MMTTTTTAVDIEQAQALPQGPDPFSFRNSVVSVDKASLRCRIVDHVRKRPATRKFP
jgi:hypothetical protein